MLSYIIQLEQNFGLPSVIAAALIIVFFSMQVIGELLEFKGKVVPEFCKIRKYFKRKKEEKIEAKQTLQDVKRLLSDVNAHYSQDNITKRDNWMQWVNNRANVYDDSIIQIKADLVNVTEALNANTKMTEEMFIQTSRDRIIDFATKVANESVIVSREEFNRIFKVYNNYETYLEGHGLTNGEIDIAYRIIREAYEARIKSSSFIEDIRGYN